MNILHQDISLGNVMVAENGRGVLADWGCAMRNIPGYTDVIHHTPVVSDFSARFPIII